MNSDSPALLPDSTSATGVNIELNSSLKVGCNSNFSIFLIHPKEPIIQLFSGLPTGRKISQIFEVISTEYSLIDGS